MRNDKTSHPAAYVHHDTSPATSPFLISAATDDDSSPVKIKKKGRFTVRTTVIDNTIGGEGAATLKEKETKTLQAANTTGKAKLRPHPNLFSPEKAHTPDVDNYDAFGLNLVATSKPKNEMETTSVLRRRPAALRRAQSYDSYISDDSSSSNELDDIDDDNSPNRKNILLEASPDISMTYSPEHPHLVGKLLNQFPGKRSQVTFDETTTDPVPAEHNHSGSYENIVHLIGHNNNSTETLCNSESVSSSLCGRGNSSAENDNEQNQLNPEPEVPFVLLPSQQQRRASSVHVSSNIRRPMLQMRCSSEPLFSSKSGKREASSLNINANYTKEMYTEKKSTTYSTDNSDSVDEDVPAGISPLTLPECEIMMLSGRNAPVHTDSDTPTPTQAEGARKFYANQQSAKKVAESQATVPFAHRPYLDYDGFDPLDAEDLTPHSFSNSNTPLSPAFCYTDEEDRDHIYWAPNAASFPELIVDDLHPSRWAMLFYLSMLNLLSGWLCFSVAPVATILEGDINVESLVSLFLIASAVATFFAPTTLSHLGLRRTVLLGAFLLLVGLKVCCASLDLAKKLHIGFIIAGLSQPLYQITPIYVVTAWFPPNEHAVMLTIVLKGNEIGVLFSFLCGTFLVSSDNDILPYFQCISLISTILFIAIAFHFEEAPPTTPTNKAFKESKPIFRQQPSVALNDESLVLKRSSESIRNIGNNASAISRMYTEQLKEGEGQVFSYGSIEPSSPFPNLKGQGSFTPRGITGQMQVWGPQQDANTPRCHETTIHNSQVLALMKACFSKEGFTRCSIAFVTSGVVANTLITFMVYLGASGSNNVPVGAIGSAFQSFIMISPFIVDKWTDPSHRHSFLSASLLAGAAALVICMIAMEWDSIAGLISSLLAIALFVGSSQALSTGRGIEISQMSENSVLIIFRLLSNATSAVAIPLFRFLQIESIAETVPASEFSLPFIMLIAMNMFAVTCFFGGNRRFSFNNVKQQTEVYSYPKLLRTSV